MSDLDYSDDEMNEMNDTDEEFVYSLMEKVAETPLHREEFADFNAIKKEIIESFSYGFHHYEMLPPIFANDFEIAISAIRQNAKAYNYLSKELQESFEIVYETLKKCGNFIDVVPDMYITDELIVFAIIDGNMDMRYAPTEIRENKKVMRSAMHQRPDIIEYFDENLFDDEEIMIEAIQIDASNRRLLSDRLKRKYFN